MRAANFGGMSFRQKQAGEIERKKLPLLYEYIVILLPKEERLYTALFAFVSLSVYVYVCLALKSRLYAISFSPGRTEHPTNPWERICHHLEGWTKTVPYCNYIHVGRPRRRAFRSLLPVRDWCNPILDLFLCVTIRPSPQQPTVIYIYGILG